MDGATSSVVWGEFVDGCEFVPDGGAVSIPLAVDVGHGAFNTMT